MGRGGGRRTGGGLTGDWAVLGGHWPHTELHVFYTGQPYTSISIDIIKFKKKWKFPQRGIKPVPHFFFSFKRGVTNAF